MRHRLLASALCAVAAACSSTSEPGLSIDLKSDSPHAEDSAEGPIVTDRGYSIALAGGHLATGGVAVTECPETAMQAFLDWLDPIAEAHAHTASSPTSLGIPFVEPIAEASHTLSDLGTLAPPPGRYCGVRYTIEPADDDAMGMPGGGEMVGWSLVVEGTWSMSGGDPVVFSLSSKESVVAELTIDALELGEGASRTATLTFTKPADRWFDGIDFAAMTAEEQTSALLSNLRASLAVTVR